MHNRDRDGEIKVRIRMWEIEVISDYGGVWVVLFCDVHKFFRSKYAKGKKISQKCLKKRKKKKKKNHKSRSWMIYIWVYIEREAES